MPNGLANAEFTHKTHESPRPVDVKKPAADICCECGSGIAYDRCCGRWHAAMGMMAGEGSAASLMRSRYVAYVRRLEDYLLATWHRSTRPPSLVLDDAPAPKWLGLEVLRVTEGSGPDQAQVEFVARYRVGGRAHRLHEHSRFVQEEGRWYYLEAL